MNRLTISFRVFGLILCSLQGAAVAQAQLVDLVNNGSFETGSPGFYWELEHSLLGEDAICTSECFSGFQASDGQFYVLLAGGTFEQNSTGSLRSVPIGIPADATTLEFDWAVLGNGAAGAPCAGPGDGVSLFIDDQPVWSNLDDGACVNVFPYETIVIDLAQLGLNDRDIHVFEFRGAATGVPPATAISNVYLDNVRMVVPAGLDSDGDGIMDSVDNCIFLNNPSQCDTDGDNLGNRCDADFNGDCRVNVVDLGIFRTLFFLPGNAGDLNCDGITNSALAIDLGLFRTLFLQPVGPSGLANACEVADDD